MSEYIGLDVSKEETSYCIMDKAGKILGRGKTDSDPSALFEMLKEQTLCPDRIIMETGSQSNWLMEGLLSKGLPVSCVCARRANAVMKLNPNKTDDNDAQMLADMARTGFYREIVIKSLDARKIRALLKARKQLVKQQLGLDNTMRGLLTSFGIKFGKGVKTLLEGLENVIAEDAAMAIIITPLLEARKACVLAFEKIDNMMRRAAQNSATCQLLMSAPGVGPVTALTFMATIDDPSRFPKARSVGAYAGLAPRRYQSGEMDYSGKISKQGDSLLRSALYSAANVWLHRSQKSHPVKSWAQSILKTKGGKKAKVALARKLSVILLAMWRNGEAFKWPEKKKDTKKETRKAGSKKTKTVSA